MRCYIPSCSRVLVFFHGGGALYVELFSPSLWLPDFRRASESERPVCLLRRLLSGTLGPARATYLPTVGFNTLVLHQTPSSSI